MTGVAAGLGRREDGQVMHLDGAPSPSKVPKLPSRYEDRDIAFRGRLRPDAALIRAVKEAHQSMRISGGIRFLPIYGKSGTGKTSSASELGTHLPEARVVPLPREAIESPEALTSFLRQERIRRQQHQILVVIIDQYEEVAAQRTAVPTAFVETLSLLDRGEFRSDAILFIWLTTSREFQSQLVAATSRNERILVQPDFELSGPSRDEWPGIIEETFRFHNHDNPLADYRIIADDLREISIESDTVGTAIERTGSRLAKFVPGLQDLSTYHVVMLWPVTDGLRITRIQQFTDARQGYRLDWNAWYRQLNADDQKQLPLREFNRARLYFDIRLVPIAAADLHLLCKDLDQEECELQPSYLERFQKTHFFSIATGRWNPDAYSPLRERESKRADEARAWYDAVTDSPVQLGRRIAKCLRSLSVDAQHEQAVVSPHSKLRADILIKRIPEPQNVLVELKAFSAENTMPSTICGAVQTTLRRHAQFAGFLAR
jgi:hypothetical protein